MGVAINLADPLLPSNNPVFSRAKQIPIKLRDKIKAELQRLVDLFNLVNVFFPFLVIMLALLL